MRIAFDQQVFLHEYGGITRYYCNLALQLTRISGVATKIIAPLHFNTYLNDMPADIVTGMKIKKIPRTARIIGKTSSIIAIPLLWSFNPDVVHETYYAAHTFAPRRAGRVITAYDMIHERFPQFTSKYDPTTYLKKKAFARVDHIICISENTRQDLLELFNVPPAKVSVVPLGFAAFTSDKHVVQKYQTQPYIFYVGKRAGYKNFDNFINAYSSSEWLKNNFRIICFGGSKFTAAEKEILTKNGINKSHIQHINGDDSVLATYYTNASVFVYPSLYEGFGFPPLEAMSAGCPVVCSNTSSIPEVVGDAGEYFNPVSIDSMRSSIEKVLQSSELRTDLRTKGFERCKIFTWKKCAEETLQIYQNI